MRVTPENACDNVRGEAVYAVFTNVSYVALIPSSLENLTSGRLEYTVSGPLSLYSREGHLHKSVGFPSALVPSHPDRTCPKINAARMFGYVRCEKEYCDTKGIPLSPASSAS